MPGGVQTDQYSVPRTQPGGSFSGNESGAQKADFFPGDLQNIGIRFPKFLLLLSVEKAAVLENLQNITNDQFSDRYGRSADIIRNDDVRILPQEPGNMTYTLAHQMDPF